MEQIIITSSRASELNKKIAKKIEEGFVPVGSHQVVIERVSNTLRGGTVIVQSQYVSEYSQTMKKG